MFELFKGWIVLIEIKKNSNLIFKSNTAAIHFIQVFLSQSHGTGQTHQNSNIIIHIFDNQYKIVKWKNCI
jgi:hypothetical protein